MERGRGGRGGGGHPLHASPARPQPNQPRGGKRKAAGGDGQASKRRHTDGAWGNQPIAQQPLQHSGYGGGGYQDYGNNAQWYQDDYGQGW